MGGFPEDGEAIALEFDVGSFLDAVLVGGLGFAGGAVFEVNALGAGVYSDGFVHSAIMGGEFGIVYVLFEFGWR